MNVLVGADILASLSGGLVTVQKEGHVTAMFVQPITEVNLKFMTMVYLHGNAPAVQKIRETLELGKPAHIALQFPFSSVPYDLASANQQLISWDVHHKNRHARQLEYLLTLGTPEQDIRVQYLRQQLAPMPTLDQHFSAAEMSIKMLPEDERKKSARDPQNITQWDVISRGTTPEAEQARLEYKKQSMKKSRYRKIERDAKHAEEVYLSAYQQTIGSWYHSQLPIGIADPAFTAATRFLTQVNLTKTETKATSKEKVVAIDTSFIEQQNAGLSKGELVKVPEKKVLEKKELRLTVLDSVRRSKIDKKREKFKDEAKRTALARAESIDFSDKLKQYVFKEQGQQKKLINESYKGQTDEESLESMKEELAHCEQNIPSVYEKEMKILEFREQYAEETAQGETARAFPYFESTIFDEDMVRQFETYIVSHYGKRPPEQIRVILERARKMIRGKGQPLTEDEEILLEGLSTCLDGN